MHVLNLEDIKALIIFCKQQKVKEMTVGSVKFQISDLAFFEDEQAPIKQKEELASSKTLTDTNSNEQAEDDEEALFWSSNS